MYEKRNPKARLLLLCSSVITMGIVTVFGVGVIFLAELGPGKIRTAIILCLALLWLISLISPFVRYNWYRARFTEEEIDIRQGFLTIKENIIPIERLQKISLETGPLDRLFGMTKVIVYTAGGEDTIRFLERERAEEIGERLKKRINGYAIEERNEKGQE
ncbi:MAG: PH domain-containing protein [Lachnospiraceae bacterium]|nr:PH domain-containing protein [Lachnospiraceae bacterium]